MSTLVTRTGRAAQDLGLAGLLGGTLFGRLALHPAVERISDPRQRGEVVNAAWRRYGAVNALSLAALTAGWAMTRDEDAQAGGALARVKDGLVATVCVAGLASGAEGMRFARQAPSGAVPLIDGSTTGPGAPPAAARMKRVLNALSATTMGVEAALVAVNAALARPPRRRRLRR